MGFGDFKNTRIISNINKETETKGTNFRVEHNNLTENFIKGAQEQDCTTRRKNFWTQRHAI